MGTMNFGAVSGEDAPCWSVSMLVGVGQRCAILSLLGHRVGHSWYEGVGFGTVPQRGGGRRGAGCCRGGHPPGGLGVLRIFGPPDTVRCMSGVGLSRATCGGAVAAAPLQRTIAASASLL